uniref:Uncharacterized protein n=1 Tax=Pithovirus LCPAC101 TaxID=2506586 RepID=A0A481Z459_9VIRU|nr:MAG: hypothetical protein LCPAC101_01110 [Pithovirus LCPAC101]
MDPDTCTKECIEECSEDSTLSHTIWTEYYTDYHVVDHLTSIQQPTPNFTSYNIFCLHSCISHWINENWSDKIDISFVGKNRLDYGSKQYITVVPMVNGEKMYVTREQASQLQSVINTSTEVDKTFVRLFSSESYYDYILDKHIPSDWLKTIISYIDVDIIYQSFTNDGIIYAHLNPYTSSRVDDDRTPPTLNYTKAYNGALDTIHEQIRFMYEYSFVVDPPEYVITNWSLKSVSDDDSLYMPQWVDDRLSRAYIDLYSFITSRMDGNKTVKYIIPSNLVAYHYLSKYLDLYFSSHIYKISNGMLYVDINNLKEAQGIADLIELISYDSDGSIIPTYSSSAYEAMLYVSSIREQYGDDVSVAVYEQDDIERPIVVSILIPLDSYINKDSILYSIYKNHNEDMMETYFEDPERSFPDIEDNSNLWSIRKNEIEQRSMLNDVKSNYIENKDFSSSVPLLLENNNMYNIPHGIKQKEKIKLYV